MLKLTPFLALLALTLPSSAQSLAVCNKPPTPAMLASAKTANQILEKVIPKDALDLDKLRKEAQKDADKHPDDPFALAVLGNIQFRAGDLEAAMPNLSRSMQLFPCIAYVHFTLAKYDALTGDSAGAQQQLELAHILAPGVPEIAREWTQSHTRQEASLRNASTNQLQRRAPLSSTPTTTMPFGALPERPRLAPVTREVELTLEKSGPPTAANTRGFTSPDFFTPNNFPTLTVMLNGKPLRLLLNLGSQELVITTTAAQRAGVSPTAPHSGVANLSIGGLELSNAPLTVTDRPEDAYNKTTLFTDGTVGLYFFSRSLIKLNIWGGKLTLSPLPAQSPIAAVTDKSRNWSALYVIPRTDQLIVSAEVGAKNPQLFLLDLNSEFSAIAPDTANRTYDVQQFHGGAGIWHTNTVRIYVGGKTVEVPSPLVSREPRFAELGMGVSGRLGRDAIRGVDLTFDYRDHLMKVN